MACPVRALCVLLAAAACSLAALTSSLPAQAQPYPSRPIRLLVGFGAGGTADVIARYYGQRLSAVLNTPIVVDNRPGAAQVLALRTLMAATPDGYTVALGTGSALSQGPALRKDLPFHPLKDFTLISRVASAPGIIVMHVDLPARSVRELVNYSQAHPGKLNFGSSGVGGASHLQFEYLISLTGLKATHIPYKADAEIMREMIAGSVQLGMSTLQAALGHISAGRLRALAVTGSKRQAVIPNVPSLSEADFKGLEGVDPYTFYGLVGPLGVPPAVVTTLNDAVNRASKMSEVVSFMQEKLHVETGAGSPAAFRAYIEAELEKWKTLSKVIKLSD